MASTLGIDPVKVYAVTFTIGAALSGLAGGLLAPISGVIPHMGAIYVARAFVTVISGGSALVAGTVSAAMLFGPLEAVFSLATTPVIGQAALLIAAIILLRVMPQGISGRWQGARR
jgi:branched-subunit amino acid ABC-type transport system permease component